MGTGVNKIDVATATEQRILVTNVPYFCVEEQADHAMALLRPCAQAPQMRQAWADVPPCPCAHAHHQRLPGRAGLVGFGNSAQAMAGVRGFGMRVIATRRNLAAAQAEAAAIGVELTDLETVVAESDYLSLHLPLNAETYHLFDAAMLQKVKLGRF
jgi:D-3-phosphoglycerate dehydrogenase